MNDEFLQYVKYLQELYGVQLSSSEIRTLATDTEGSPLFVDSFFRLLRLGAKFGDAVRRWKGKDGEAVRAASFKRELDQLSWGARRVLYAISLFETASSAEINRVTELEVTEVESAIADLSGLFLVQSKQIGDQARFSVSPNLRRLLDSYKAEFVANHAEILRRATLLRQESRGGSSRGSNRDVGEAIQQAIAQLAGGNAPGGKATIEAVLPSYPENADLWMVYARCLSACTPIDLLKTRQAFQRSYSFGKREPQLFRKWIEFEIEHGNSNAAVDVCEKGGQSAQMEDWQWIAKCSGAYLKRSLERESRREFSDALADAKQADKHIVRAIRKSPVSAKTSVASIAQRINDTIWRIVCNFEFSNSDRFNAAKLAVQNGDRREICLLRMLDSVEEAISQRAIDQVHAWLGEISHALENRHSSKAESRLKMLRGQVQDG